MVYKPFPPKHATFSWCLPSCSSQQQSLALTSDLSVLELTRKELENKMGSLKEQHQRDATSLKTLLNEAENQAKDAQNEVNRNIFLHIWALVYKKM